MCYNGTQLIKTPGNFTASTDCTV